MVCNALLSFTESQAVDAGEHGADRCAGDVGADADTIGNLSGVAVKQMDIGCRLRIRTGLKRMLLIIEDPDIETEFLAKSALERIERSIAECFKELRYTVIGIIHADLCRSWS